MGVNGLFSDILNVLALSELGAGTAITYALYRPIAEHDLEKQKSLMKFYRRFYQLVSLIVLLAGVCLIPFMDFLIKDGLQIEHITLIYLMYLGNSVLSYQLIYKKTLIDAHQLSYIGVAYQTVFLMLQNLVQIVVLLLTKNFIFYLAVYLFCTLAGNVCISRKANRLYPYLKEKNVAPMEKEERKEIFRNIRAMLMHKIGTVAVNNTDNLLISSMVGIQSVGKYSNYYLLIGSVQQVLHQFFQGVTASVGNMAVTEQEDKVRTVFESTFFLNQWLYGFVVICLYELLNPFVEISFGAGYLFPQDIVLVLCLNFYVSGMRKTSLVFKDSLGLFWFDRHKALIEAVINLAVSFFLAVRFGVAGIFLGTLASTLATSFWVEPWVFYHHFLQESSRRYFMKYAVYAAVAGVAGILTDSLCRWIEGGAWTLLLARLPICLLLPNALFLLCYLRTWEFRFLKEKAAALFLKKRNYKK